jgi:hypothetical protein
MKRQNQRLTINREIISRNKIKTRMIISKKLKDISMDYRDSRIRLISKMNQRLLTLAVIVH